MEHEPDQPRPDTAAPTAETTTEPRPETDPPADETTAAETEAAEAVIGEITVEPGAPRPGTEAAEPEPEPAPDVCLHRVRLRDLTPGGRALAALGLLAALLAGLLQLAALFAGGFLVSIGAEFAERALAEGILLILGSMFAMIGVFALPGTWRRLHRPEAPILWLTITGTLLTTAALYLLGETTALPWAAAVALPNLAVAALLAYLRTVLDPRETCDTNPALPTRSRYLRHP
ncbi:hypothetical protein ACFQS3_18950 [Glycomyces mayteni]|uniref:Uncharacterized protein n=1 Tax=Glycomyces mayteni TaxID=543887 RepID=A0ABW2DES5_9ACTN|nr:hypothetical protein GCM10025732_02700 [Glycomyces mayteni]